MSIAKLIISISTAIVIWYFHFRRNRGLIYCVLGLMMLIVAIGVTAGTADKASQKGGLYVLYLGKILNIAPKIYEGSVKKSLSVRI